MKVLNQIAPLVHDGLIDKVIRPLLSGKEAVVYLVVANGEPLCAKVYREANKRNFRQRTQYQEGRKVRNTRRARAMEKGTRYGKREQEDAWQNAEVDAMRTLIAAGVRVPKPHLFVDGVLLMELVVDADGDPAPKIGDLHFTPEEALAHHQTLVRQVVRMLCAGLIHGDLSEYNVLMDLDGPVIIDLPQVVNAAGNNNARQLLERDVDNLTSFFGRFAPELLATRYGREIWNLYEKAELAPESELTGRFAVHRARADVANVRDALEDARADAERRFGLRVFVPRKKRRGPRRGRPNAAPSAGEARPSPAPAAKPSPDKRPQAGSQTVAPPPGEEKKPKTRRRRRRRRRPSAGAGQRSESNSAPKARR